MRVILLADAVRYPLTGIGRYTIELHRALSGVGVTSRLWRDGQFRDACSQPMRANDARSTTLLYQLARGVARRAPAWRHSLESMWRWWDAKRLRLHADGVVLHGANFHVPALPCARVVTIHDLSVFSWQDCHPRDRVMSLRPMIEASLRSAHRIITCSEFNRRELIDRFQLPADRVVAVPLACDARFRPDAPCSPSLELPTGAYALWVGTVEPRKNLDTLLSAWEILPDGWRERVPLVIAGGRGWCSDDLHARMGRAHSEGWLHYLGFVPDADLPGLYARASVFCFPSHYEGFGLPLLEAMASGVPVIASTASCLPEVGGDAVRYASPDSVEAWVCEIVQVLSDSTEANRLRGLGLAQAARFSWERTALLTKDVYEQAQHAFSARLSA